MSLLLTLMTLTVCIEPFESYLQRGVESILLIERLSKDARNYLRQPPKNCREAFTLEGDQVYAGAEQRFYTSMQKSAKILREDTDNEIRSDNSLFFVLVYFVKWANPKCLVICCLKH